MTEAEFAYLRRFVKELSGLDLGPEKRYLAESRLAPLCRELSFASLSDLVKALPGSEGALGQAVVDAMATHETMFFRDRVPFETLREEVLPRLMAARAAERRLRVWSAASSTGQEAYSLAMLLDEFAHRLRSWDVSILGTDLSQAAISRARAGTYTQFEVQRGLPVRSMLKYFTQSHEGWTISPALRARVEFRQLNLLNDFSRLGRFDVIFCRNLLIYLDRSTKAALLDRLSRALAPDGFLCLGAAEQTTTFTNSLAPHPECPGYFVTAERVPDRVCELAAS